MNPVKLIAVKEDNEDRIPASIHVNDLKGKNLCMIWIDGQITFAPAMEYSIDEVNHFSKLASLFHTLFNNLLELQQTIEEQEKEIKYNLIPTLIRH